MAMVQLSYRPRQSFFHSLDPVSKFFWLLSNVALAFALFNFVGEALLLLSLIATAVWLAKIPPRNIVASLEVFALIVFMLFILQSLTYAGPRSTFIVIGPVTVSLEGINYASSVALRIMNTLMTSMIFVTTTAPRDIALAAVQKGRLNYVVGYMLFLAVRYIPLIEGQVQIMNEAHKIRGVGNEPGLRGMLARFRRFAVPVFAATLARARLTAYSMDSRAFRAYPTRTYLKQIEITRQGKLLAIAYGVVALIALLVVFLFIGRQGYS